MTMTMADYHDEMSRNIAQHGRHIMGVFPFEDSDDPINECFMYTVGNHPKGLPELLLIGTIELGAMLDALSRKMIERNRAFDDGELVPLKGGKFPVSLIDTADAVKDSFTIQAGQHFGHETYRVMQVVLPDLRGKYPWQRKCASPYCRVKVHYRTARQ